MTASGERRYDHVKRVLDLVVAIVALIITLPVQLVVAALVAIALGRPVLFLHPRPGKDGKIFTLIKFRTMLAEDGPHGRLTDDERLPRFGRWLRATSLDELPTLLNVIKGDMSIVGPRPLHVRYLERYSAEQARRHEVRPGVTGLAQINGRNAIDWQKRLALDVDYVDRRSAALDFVIVLRTIGLVLRREGITDGGSATKEEFRGNALTAEEAQ